MRQSGYINCCGAYFLFDVSLEDLKNVPKKEADFPKIKAAWDTYTDWKWAPVASTYIRSPSIAYWIIVLKKEEHTKEMQEALAKHSFELKSSTKDHFLYVRSRPKKK